MNSSISNSDPMTRGPLPAGASSDRDGRSVASSAWRRWLLQFVSIAVGGLLATFLLTVLVDPFSTGRFAITQRIDRTPVNQWFAKAGIVRDAGFDAALIGSSVAGTLDPSRIGEITGRTVVQLSLYGVVPQNLLAVARAYDRHHRSRPTLQIYVLEENWCYPAHMTQTNFPVWLYQSSDREYLSHIFHPEALEIALRRVGIWMGLADQSMPANGFAPIYPRNLDKQVARARLLASAPELDRPPPEAPLPSLDELASHLATLDSRSPVVLVFVPIYANMLPPVGSVAQLRDAACKDRVRGIAEARPNSAYLDLQGDNAWAHDIANYLDSRHFDGDIARSVEVEIARAAEKLLSARD